MDKICGLHQILTKLALGTAFCLFTLFSLQAAPPDNAEMFPIAVGNKWTYQAGPIELVEEIVGIDEIKGERCARLETRVNGKQTVTEHVVLRPDGVYRVTIAGFNVSPPICFLNLSTPTVPSWEVDSRVEGISITGKFERGQEKIQVPAGTWNAVSVRGTGFETDTGSLEITSYFAPGVGKVKQVISTNGKSTELLLKEYHLAR